MTGPAAEAMDAAHRCALRGVRCGLARFGLGLGRAFGGERLAEALAGAGQEGSRGHVADAEGRGQFDAGQVVEFGQQEGRPLSFRDPGERALHVARQVGVHDEVLGRRRGPARLAGPREEPDDLAPADLVERDPMGDLVEPGAGVLGLLERLVVLVGLDERVLGQVGGELRLAQHPQQVGVDLAVVLGEQRLDEDAGLVVIPHAAHRAGSRSGRGATAERSAKVCESGFGDHGYSERDGSRSAVIGRRALVGPKTTGLPPV